MHVLLVKSAHSAGSVHYRIDEPARAIRETDADVEMTLRTGIPTTMRPTADGGAEEIVDVDSSGADVVVLQLPKTPAMLQTIRLLQSRGVAVVVEVDDLLSGVPYGHMGHHTLVRRGMAQVFEQCAREADLVIAS